MIKIKNPYEQIELCKSPSIKRPNKGIQKYGRYKLSADLESAKTEARIQYRERVKNQKTTNKILNQWNKQD